MDFKIRYSNDLQISRLVKVWLVVGLGMILMQVVLGGITRLTGSGLSITKWDIVVGTLPPLGDAQWEAAFDLYKQTPQYHKINAGMTLSEFRFIYFWEYFHRLWARLMFFVFAIPFGWFLLKGMLSRRLTRRLIVVVGLAGLEGFFGWIMVFSGLRDRPWVNAYNLTLHLCMALIIFSYLLWTAFIAFQPEPQPYEQKGIRRLGWVTLGIAFIQIAFGAMMSGTKAGLFFPTWPDMNGMYLPGIILDGSQWNAESFVHYDTNPFIPALIQFLHRNTAYLLIVLIAAYYWRMWGQPISNTLRKGNLALVCMLGVQVLLGIFTLINCKARVPVDLGVAHQGGAVILFALLLFINYHIQSQPRTAFK
jgi:cytochrome c oxidase assembly protein subunit 15